MCGIVGYLGPREVTPLLVDGLKRLEYRGYDSCGIAVLGGEPQVVRAVGRIGNLEKKLRQAQTRNEPVSGTYGIGHTRWATHGRPTEENAHPHRDCSGKFIVVHNGIIENYLELKAKLIEQGHVFRTATDTEVLPHLIETFFEGNLEDAIRAALKDVEGVYGMVAVSAEDPDKMVVVRNGPPIVIGVGQDENFIASDIPALLPFTREMLFLNDGDIAVVRRDSISVTDRDGKSVKRNTEFIEWNADSAEKEGYPHFMLKEIHEQPSAVRDTLRGRLKDGLVQLDDELGPAELLSGIGRIYIVACGTSMHAGLVGKFMIESLAGVPVEVDYASEFRYRNPRVGPNDLVVAITQSGETADTLAALNEARQKGAFVLSICNVVGSMAARQSDAVLYTHAGPEIAVASTKAFTTQLAALALFALHLARIRSALPLEEIRRYAARLSEIPDLMERTLIGIEDLGAVMERFHNCSDFLFLGRGVNYPIALEGALKLKEISYIHAEGYPAGEMKHGPIALIDDKMPVVAIAPDDSLYKKMLSNVEEVKGRDGVVIAVVSEGDRGVSQVADFAVRVPRTDPLLTPLLTVIPLQLLAYHAAVLRGFDVDKPRNLAKSVTVE